jgi:hypothetical protein
MQQEKLVNLHYAYMGMVRHWHRESEAFTGADALFTALDTGWDMDNVVTYKEFWHAGMRRVVVCYFTLRRDGEEVVMPVINNPYVSRLIRTMRVQTVRVETPPVSRARAV